MTCSRRMHSAQEHPPPSTSDENPLFWTLDMVRTFSNGLHVALLLLALLACTQQKPRDPKDCVRKPSFMCSTSLALATCSTEGMEGVWGHSQAHLWHWLQHLQLRRPQRIADTERRGAAWGGRQDHGAA